MREVGLVDVECHGGRGVGEPTHVRFGTCNAFIFLSVNNPKGQHVNVKVPFLFHSVIGFCMSVVIRYEDL